MAKIIKIGLFLAFLFLVSRGAISAQTDNRDELRDRITILCDPVENPRVYRGEVIDCSNYPLPTTTLQPTPTTSGGGNGGVPTASPTQSPSSGGSTTSEEDACASGKSYTGPYCGWSPEKDKPSNNELLASVETPKVGGPQILGLSHTSSSDLTLSDIMLLGGVLCLLLYVRSKTLHAHRV